MSIMFKFQMLIQLTLILPLQAYAAAKFADACLRGLRGDGGIVECSYVASQVSFLSCIQFETIIQVLL